jgi:tetratricopeptide (TPR) repeat protein/transcriptional regulator with XRE-family HTH domain
VAEPPVPALGELLKLLRARADLTQEELAEAARVSPRSVSDMERNLVQKPRKETVRLLADALGLSGAERARFEAAARGRPAAGPAAQPDEQPAGRAGGQAVAAATRTLPRDTAAFTGRDAELAELLAAAAAGHGQPGVVGVHAIGGMAGVGKTAFAVHAAHLLAPQFPDGQVYLPLHGHTPGRQPVDPADALASLLLTTGVSAQQIPAGLEPRTGLWRSRLAGQRILIVLDDASGHEQVTPLLPGTPGALVLVTSRLHLAALDARTVSLDTLPADEASRLLVTLAARAGLDPGDAAVREIVELSGYLPLAIGMLGSQLRHHPVWTAAELAADLGAARDRLELMAAENQSVAAAFGLSYAELSDVQQHLFRRLGLHPGTDTDAYAAAALDGCDLVTARRGLSALYDHYLLSEPSRGRYRLHDLLAEHARALAAADPRAQSQQAAERLLDYYAHAARTADRFLAARASGRLPAWAGPAPAHAPDLDSREKAAAWLGAERASLHAAASHAAARGMAGHATAIPAAMHGYLRGHGYWDEALSLHRAALGAARQAGDQGAEAACLDNLGDIQGRMGDYQDAVASHESALRLFRALGDPAGEAGALSHLGVVDIARGRYPEAAASFTEAMRLLRAVGDPRGEAAALAALGSVQYLTGRYEESGASLAEALLLFRRAGDQSGIADALNRLGGVQYLTGQLSEAMDSLAEARAAYRELGDQAGELSTLSYIGDVQRAAGDYPAALASQQEVLARATELGSRLLEAGAHSDIGTVREALGEPAAAIASQEQALVIYRELGSRPGEALALSHLGTARRAAGEHDGAASALTGALGLYREMSDRLGEAECLNNLGELDQETGRPGAALDWHEQARALAAELSAPLELARALDGIGRCRLALGQAADALAPLRKASAIYQRIGSPGAAIVQRLLAEHDPDA